MGLRWEQRSSSRWLGYDDDRQIAFVGETVSAGGTRRTWFSRRQDGSPVGASVGEFETAQDA
jgi:hypothetical protein